ncbi:sodium:proton antiporter [Hasllibacter sp. MH4015]|uniref:cation:proton antiporter n=1 Tax=Hasllibacter sp. MH4015 TaxID=2854029 RepID=UPI001CD341F5|nr:cation:proton antiporter [Hasllibacter sp. MH4015]
MIDDRDVFYTVAGLAFLGLTLQPALSKYRLANFPLIYVACGALLAWIGLPTLDPLASDLQARVLEHMSELIVIISLAGAGLAIDARLTWKNGNAAYRLLLVTMPLTIIAVAWLGMWLLGMSLAAAMLLAAALAPTDPVLARSVQVEAPGKGETPMQLALTTEAGLNDGLAFPFIYLAISIALYGASQGQWQDWIWDWLSFDFAYRVAAAIVVGYAVGWILTRFATSPWGDASNGAWNSIIMVLGATMLSYGVTEAVDGYGFLAVFVATRAGRSHTRDTDQENYEKFVHHGADQLESILLALLLIWLGMYAASGVLDGIGWREWALALLLLLVVRPAAGFLAMVGLRCDDLSRWKVAAFGIRGMGSIFYIAYAQNHADFGADIEGVWAAAILTILLSIVLHGFGASFTIGQEETADTDDEGGEVHPYKAASEGRSAAE